MAIAPRESFSQGGRKLCQPFEAPSSIDSKRSQPGSMRDNHATECKPSLEREDAAYSEAILEKGAHDPANNFPSIQAVGIQGPIDVSLHQKEPE